MRLPKFLPQASKGLRRAVAEADMTVARWQSSSRARGAATELMRSMARRRSSPASRSESRCPASGRPTWSFFTALIAGRYSVSCQSPRRPLLCLEPGKRASAMARGARGVALLKLDGELVRVFRFGKIRGPHGDRTTSPKLLVSDRWRRPPAPAGRNHPGPRGSAAPTRPSSRKSRVSSWIRQGRDVCAASASRIR
jgi:hypothetical protein